MVAEDHPVRKVLEKVVADASINADQVAEMERFVREDWVIDEREAKFLFRVNHALGDNQDDCPEWNRFFVYTVARLVVLDMNTPGQIDEDEGNWLGEMFDEYSVGNDAEKELMAELQKTTTSITGKIGQRIQPADKKPFG